ncbi:MAG TPA: adenylosuccinate synthase [Polyangiaceae bacterium]|jgi:adenylosuccinate synthase|nr:adenylosuccinate synthase [Polyangiaceae bacterium]
MSCVAVIGAQWGDEGKGKIVDFYTEFANMVVRWGGGPNAGHTLVVNDDKVVVRLLPSGILREGTKCVLGQGMVVDLAVLLGEIDELGRRGQKGIAENLVVSNRAHLVLSYHILVDGLREARQGIGTTKKGIGPAYEDKVRRTGIRAGDLADFGKLAKKVEAALEQWAPIIQGFGGEVPTVDSVVTPLEPLARRVLPLLGDASKIVDHAIRTGGKVLLEGAQGTLLDVDHGTYPYVTSSSPVAGGAAVGAGIGPNRIDTVIGITKAYATRVGGGPFPTELDDSDGVHLREVGAEFGAVTGRPRRTGWLDLPALKYAARVNGLDGLALTKLDVLTGLKRIRVCVAYDTKEGRVTDFPIDLIDEPGRATPVYEELEGWSETLGNARVLDDLPLAARAYVRFLEEGAGVPLFLVSVGPRRRETIILHNPFVGRAAAP